MRHNEEAVVASSTAIAQNEQTVRQSTEVISENGKAVAASTVAIRRNQESLSAVTAVIDRLSPGHRGFGIAATLLVSAIVAGYGGLDCVGVFHLRDSKIPRPIARSPNRRRHLIRPPLTLPPPAADLRWAVGEGSAW